MMARFTPYGTGDTCRNDDKEDSRPICPECGERYGSHDEFVQDDFCSFECGEEYFNELPKRVIKNETRTA